MSGPPTATQNTEASPQSIADQLAPVSRDTASPAAPAAAKRSPFEPIVKSLTLDPSNSSPTTDQVSPPSFERTRAMQRPQVPASSTPGDGSLNAK